MRTSRVEANRQSRGWLALVANDAYWCFRCCAVRQQPYETFYLSHTRTHTHAADTHTEHYRQQWCKQYNVLPLYLLSIGGKNVSTKLISVVLIFCIFCTECVVVVWCACVCERWRVCGQCVSAAPDFNRNQSIKCVCYVDVCVCASAVLLFVCAFNFVLFLASNKININNGTSMYCSRLYLWTKLEWWAMKTREQTIR